MPHTPAASAASPAVLLTGATGGIGRALLRELLDRGYRVHAAARNPAADLADLPGVHPVALDVTDAASLAAAAEKIRAQGDTGLHAVINNAGTIVQGPLELVPEHELHRQFEVNVYGPALVTQQFLPFLRQGKGRLVNVTAGTARLTVPFLGAISASKAALQSFSDALRVELRPWGIPVVVVEPGATETAIFDKAADAADAALAGIAPERVALYRAQLDLMDAVQARTKGSPPALVAKAITKAVTATRPKERYTVGADVRALGVLSRLPLGTRDRLITRALGLHKVPAAG
ncbi:SDR family NAD(P)-dependent oxidoreductase [Streptomyces avicenniae]|uniref:SDR family NAD(P)-dependent oxidoreductase n=1 Tax=Streptomyces avicenniae TaxID=500153 RepID=UPI00069A87C9|nr:SDR family NAD(P)-dependent oxidoreductase [Streptomyces avicenniae]